MWINRISERVNSLESKTSKLVVYTILYISIIDFAFAVLLGLFQFRFISNLLFFNSLVYFFIFFPMLLFNKYERLIKICVPYFTACLLVLAGCYYGPNLNIHETVVIGTLYPFIAFSGKEKLERLICLLAPFLQFVVLKTFAYNIFNSFDLETAFLGKDSFASHGMSVTTILIVTLAYFIFTWQNEKIESELKILNISLASKAKFVGSIVQIVVHDVANSLSVAQCFLDREVRNLQNNRNLSIALKSTKEITEIIGNVRNLYAFHLGKRELQLEIENIEKIIEECIFKLKEESEKKNILIKFEHKSRQHPVKANIRLLKYSIILNLMTNAIKFSPVGSMVEIEVKKDDDNVIVYVKDNGIGIPKKLVQYIFDDTNTSRIGTQGEKGTGLGLLIAKWSANLMGGKLEVSSQTLHDHSAESGCTFILRLKQA